MAYVGPGDIKTFAAWWGLRAYSAAACGTACADIQPSVGGTITAINSLANGDFDSASAATALGGNSGFITKLYDQTGGGKHMVQLGGTQPQIQLNVLQGGTLPEIRMPGVSFVTGFSMSATGLAAVANPWTVVAAANQLSNAAASTSYLLCSGTTGAAGAQYFCYPATDLQINMADFFGGSTPAITDNAYHRFVAVDNSGSSFVYIDGASNSVSGGASNFAAGAFFGTVQGGSSIKMVEVGIIAANTNSTDAASLDTNINNYWFVAAAAGYIPYNPWPLRAPILAQ